MLPKPVTAFALSALVSIASFIASSAVAAPSGESAVTTSSSSSVKEAHPKKKGVNKGQKKSKHLALHSAEPRTSPHPAGDGKESPKLAASLSSHLDLQKTSDKGSHHASTKKGAVLATAKEVTLGAKGGHRAGTGPVSSKPAGKIAASTAVPLRGLKASAGTKSGAMAKSSRAPSRPVVSGAIATTGAEDHPVVSASIAAAIPVVRVAAVTPGLVAAKGARPPCFHDSIEFVRGAETERFPLTRCDGSAAPLAGERLSVLARPESARAPASITELAKVKGAELAPGIRSPRPRAREPRRAHRRALRQAGAPPRIAIVSGYRPASKGSFHATAQALDFHLEGVPNEEVAQFCKTLENTGCGYYPNSSFVHVDVRAPGTGHVAWIDASGPGEAPHYVASWPPPPDAEVKVARAEVDTENPSAGELPELPAVRGNEAARAPRPRSVHH